jgi:RimJ/RimL family protein N-acetyltransferase
VGLDSLGLTLAAIKTERLELAPLQIEDADVLVDVLADENLHEFVGGRPATIPELRRHYARLVSGSGRPDELWLNWVGRRLEDGAAIGTMQAAVRVTGGQCRASVAWTVGSPWQGRGYASEAARAVVDWLCGHGADEVVAYVHPRHEASARVAARAGLEPTENVFEGERIWRLRTEGASRRPRR